MVTLIVRLGGFEPMARFATTVMARPVDVASGSPLAGSLTVQVYVPAVLFPVVIGLMVNVLVVAPE